MTQLESELRFCLSVWISQTSGVYEELEILVGVNHYCWMSDIHSFSVNFESYLAKDHTQHAELQICNHLACSSSVAFTADGEIS